MQRTHSLDMNNARNKEKTKANIFQERESCVYFYNCTESGTEFVQNLCKCWEKQTEEDED